LLKEPGERGERTYLTNRGWTRFAYLLFALAVLLALAQLGNPSADPQPLLSEPRDGYAVEGRSQADEAEWREPAPREAAARTAFAERDGRDDDRYGAHYADTTSADVSRELVFYRPVLASPTARPGGGMIAGPTCGDLGSFPSNRRLVFPVPKKYFSSYEDSWRHPGRRAATRGRTSWRRRAPPSTP
jgi:hypothetical protein